MSKLVDATIRCPKCGNEYPVKLFRTIWGENECNKNMVLEDRINVCTCPHCNFSFKAPYPFMYVDVKKGFAVWWEPTHDEGIDSDSAGYAKMFGANSYYATAPRISDWENFKKVVREYDNGNRVGNPIEKFDFKALSSNKNSKKGCLNILVFVIISVSVLYTLL